MSLLSMYCFDKSRAMYLNSSVQQQYQMSSTCQNPVSSCLATIALKANKSYSRALCILTPSFPTDNLLLKKCSAQVFAEKKALKPPSLLLLLVVGVAANVSTFSLDGPLDTGQHRDQD